MASPDRTYPVRMMSRAREHAEGGWSVNATCRLLESEFGRSPCWTTVKCWVDPRYRESRLSKNQRWRARLSDTTLMARVVELHGAGLSPRAISVVCRVVWGVELTDRQVEYRLRKDEP